MVIYNHFSPFLSYPYFMNMWCSDDETDESLVSQQLYWSLNISVIVKSTNSCIGHLWKNQLWRLKSAGKTHVFERLHTHKEAMLSAHHTGCLTREKLLQYNTEDIWYETATTDWYSSARSHSFQHSLRQCAKNLSQATFLGSLFKGKVIVNYVILWSGYL